MILFMSMISIQCHAPRLPSLVSIRSGTPYLSSTNECFKYDWVRRIHATMHSFVIEAAQIFLILPSPAIVILATSLHAALSTFTSDRFDISQTKALSRLLIRIPCI